MDNFSGTISLPESKSLAMGLLKIPKNEQKALLTFIVNTILISGEVTSKSFSKYTQTPSKIGKEKNFEEK